MRRVFGPCGYASRRDVVLAADMDTVCEEEDFEAWMVHRKATRTKKDAQGGGEQGSRVRNRPSAEGRAENGLNRRTGERNRWYTCFSEYHFAPQCTPKENRYAGVSSSLRQGRKPPSKPNSIATESPIEVGSPGNAALVGPARSRENSFSTILELGGQFAATQSESVVVLDTGLTANSVSYNWLGSLNLFLEEKGIAKAAPYPSPGRFKFGDGRAGEVKRAVDIMVGNTGREGAFAALALDAEIPTFLRKGALEALGDQLDFENDVLSPWRHGVRGPLNANEMGHYVLSVVEFSKGPPRSDRRPILAASCFEWPFLGKRPDLSGGGLHLPLVVNGLLRFVPPKDFSACTAATLGDAWGDSTSDPEKIITKLHVNGGHASATQLIRVSVGSEGGNSHSANFADEVSENCDVCRALDKAPHVPNAGTSAVPMFNEKAQVDLPFLGDLVALRAMDMFSKYSLLLPVQPKNPREAWGVFCGGRLGASGPRMRIQMDEGGEWENEVWADLRAERRIKLQFQGVGDHPLLWEGCKAPARGICNRFVEDGRFMNKTILSEAQWCLNTMLSACGFSAHQMVFGSNPVDLLDWEDGDEDLMFAQVPPWRASLFNNGRFLCRPRKRPWRKSPTATSDVL